MGHHDLQAKKYKNPKTFGELLRLTRAKKRMTMRELSKLSKVSMPSINTYQRDVCLPPFTIMVKLADALDLKLDDIADVYRRDVSNRDLGEM